MNFPRLRFCLIFACLAVLAGCAITPPGPPPEVVRLQHELDRVHADPNVVAYGGQELADADVAVAALANTREPRRVTEQEFQSRIYIADLLIQTAEASALARYAEQRGKDLAAERDRLTAQLTGRANPPPLAPGAVAAPDLRRALGGLPVHDSDRGLVVTLDDQLFEPNRRELRPRAYALLDQIVRAMRNDPTSTATVEGHTDNSGNRHHDQNLSVMRAEAVRGYIVNHGITAGRLTAGGVGSDYPIASNATPPGRTQNSRVDVIFHNARF